METPAPEPELPEQDAVASDQTQLAQPEAEQPAESQSEEIPPDQSADPIPPQPTPCPQPVKVRLPAALTLTIALQAAATLLLAALLLRDFEPLEALWNKWQSHEPAQVAVQAPTTAAPAVVSPPHESSVSTKPGATGSDIPSVLSSPSLEIEVQSYRQQHEQCADRGDRYGANQPS